MYVRVGVDDVSRYWRVSEREDDPVAGGRDAEVEVEAGRQAGQERRT